MKRTAAVLLLFILVVAAFPPAGTRAQESARAWKQIAPGGKTGCANGSPYSFYVRDGAPSKLLVYFEGGGACWNNFSCRPGSDLYKAALTDDETAKYIGGIFNVNNTANPVADYTQVFVPYCTGDLHMGDATVDYTLVNQKFAVHFNGYQNVEAALSYLYKNYETPAQVFVTGSSAGAYAAIFYAPSIATHYAKAKFIQLGDAGVGVLNTGAINFDAWHMREVAQTLYPDDTSDSSSISINKLYEQASQKFPDATFAEYTSAHDATQKKYFELLGGKDWAAGMEAALNSLNKLPNFHSFVAGGDVHVILPRPEFYTYTANGVSVRDWLADLLAGKPVQNAHCAQCDTPETK